MRVTKKMIRESRKNLQDKYTELFSLPVWDLNERWIQSYPNTTLPQSYPAALKRLVLDLLEVHFPKDWGKEEVKQIEVKGIQTAEDYMKGLINPTKDSTVSSYDNFIKAVKELD